MHSSKQFSVSAALAMAIFSTATLATLPFGHYGPQGTVLFLNGFHFVSGHTDWEISANHYCTIIRDDLLQCAVYNTATAPAHLAGVEYIVTADAFDTFDYEERQLWHSHAYEITSGFLVEPGLPASVDHTIMKDVLANTYGKTFRTWRYDQQNSTYPFGIPELVVGFTQDDQITPDFVLQRDDLFGINTTEVRESRADIVPDEVLPGADSWKYGYVLTLGLLNQTANMTFAQDSAQAVLT